MWTKCIYTYNLVTQAFNCEQMLKHGKQWVLGAPQNKAQHYSNNNIIIKCFLKCISPAYLAKCYSQAAWSTQEEPWILDPCGLDS